ncbi:MAG: hypothetical protein ACOY0T_41100 [Myxococcota bacterium]
MFADIFCNGELIGQLEVRGSEMRSVFGKFTHAPGFESIRSLVERIQSLSARIESEDDGGRTPPETETELEALRTQLGAFSFTARWENGSCHGIEDVDWRDAWFEFNCP